MDIVKGKQVTIEYGDYDNFVDVTPTDIKVYISNNVVLATIIGNLSDGKEIAFVQEDVTAIDFESFGSTFMDELNHLGLKAEDVQQHKGQLHVIKNEDGSVTPFQTYKVTFDYVTPGPYGYTDKKTIQCDARGEEAAERYAKLCMRYPAYMKNIKVEKG